MHYFAMIGFSEAMPEVGVVRGRCIFSTPSWVDGRCDGNSRPDVNLLSTIKNCRKNQVSQFSSILTVHRGMKLTLQWSTPPQP